MAAFCGLFLPFACAAHGATWHLLAGGSHWWTLPANAAFALLVSMAIVVPMKRLPLLRHMV